MSVTRDYLSCTESATMLRASLKRTFPGVKFSVRSKSYAGGASIAVGWTDGPTSEAVGRVTQRFEGADFDGMQDLKSPKEQILVGVWRIVSHFPIPFDAESAVSEYFRTGGAL